MVLPLSARGLAHGDIPAHLAEVYGASVCKVRDEQAADRPVYVVGPSSKSKESI